MDAAPPFISGCYIVKDEEEFLGRSLKAIAPFVDEVVVYDTGSTDRTVEIAQAAGARVVAGFWDEDFGAARNRALSHCRGEWVLNVDADEVASGDARAVRRALRTSDNHAWSVEIVSASWGDGGVANRTPVGRLMRRSHCTWRGALHEQIVGRWSAIQTLRMPHMTLDHYGYTHHVMRERDKGTRNLTMAQTALERARARGSADIAELLVNAGRSAALAGKYDLALEYFDELDLHTTPRWLGLLAGSAAIMASMSLADPDSAGRWLEHLRAWGEDEQVCLAREGEIALVRGEFDVAERLLTSVQDSTAANGLPFHASTCTDSLVTALARQGKAREAADVLIEHAARGGTNLPPVSVVMHCASVPGALSRLAVDLSEALLLPFIASLKPCVADVSLPFYDALWSAGRARTALLVAAADKWPSLTIDQALTWSVRLREAGLPDLCPLPRMVEDGERDLRSRITSGAVLVEIGDDSVLPTLEALLSAVSDDDVSELLAELERYAPRFAATLVPA